MNPAFSVIFFTTASGAGYGLLGLLGLFSAGPILPESLAFKLVSLVLAFGLITAGLLASAAHLGHPERAWRALSQWRSSWLSREGVLAIVTYIPALLFALSWLTGGASTETLGIVTALLASATVFCTGMIYSSLKPIRQWNTPLVTRNYLLFAVFSGAACLTALVALFGGNATTPALLTALLAASGLFAKLRYWRLIDSAKPITTLESATGLGDLGKVRMLESPNTQDNYLLKEMGFRIGRKHAARLRRIALVAGFIAPALLMVLAVLAGGTPGALLALLGAALAMLGLIAERWLFFAEATHTVTLYYGQPA
jgi:DMSO reductase anchor subunit